MSFQNGIKFQSYIEFWDYIPEQERIITDVLRQLILENIPSTYSEKIAYNVPFYYGKRRICFIWPSTIPWGGFHKGVMLGFCNGNKLVDQDKFLSHGTNKQVYYKIFNSEDEIVEQAIVSLLSEAVLFDLKFK